MIRPFRALVVEDDIFWRDIIKEEFKQIGIKVRSAESVKMARKAIRQSILGFDIISVDLSIGEGKASGIEFIKTLPANIRNKVIIVSSNSDSIFLKYANILKVNTFLDKTSISFRESLKNSIKKMLKEKEEKETPFKFIKRGRDSTAYLISVPSRGGYRLVEYVSFIEEKERFSICASPRTGCAYGCTPFCATGSNPESSNPRFIRNLEEWELLYCIKLAESNFPDSQKTLRVSFAGMGDAIDNLSVPRIMAKLLNEYPGKYSFKFSTIGIVGKLERFLGELRKNKVESDVQLSLHFANEEKRHLHMPATKKSPLEKVIPQLIKYIEETKKMLTLNYMPLENVNDSEDDIKKLQNFLWNNEALMRLMGAEKCRLRLSAFNENPFGPDCKGTSQKKFEEIAKHLKRRFVVQVFYSLGTDVYAGCGQLTASLTGSEITS